MLSCTGTLTTVDCILNFRYLETTLLDAKAIFAERIEVARNRDDDLEEGKIAMEAETEDIERLMLQVAQFSILL